MSELYLAPWLFKSYGHGVRIYEHCTILKPEMISIGDHARIDARTRIEGGMGCDIGERTHIGSGSALNVGGGELSFGSHSGCSVNVVIATGNPDYSYLKISAAEAPEDCHVIKRRTTIGEYVVLIPANKLSFEEMNGFKVDSLKSTLGYAKLNEVYAYALNYIKNK